MIDDTFVCIPVGISKYIVVKGTKILRAAHVCGAIRAKEVLKPRKSKGEYLYIKVGDQ